MKPDRRRLITGVAALAALGAPPAAAAPPRWRVAPERSEIRFGYRLDGRRAEGRFARFSGSGLFDPEAPGAAALTLSIEAESIDLGNALASAYATSAEWFDTRSHPRLAYTLERLAHLGADRYAATGRLSVKARTAPIRSTLRLAVAPREARARGRLALSRSAFALGTELTDLVVDLGDEVTVDFDLVAIREA